MCYSIVGFDKIFKRISARVDASIVFNSFYRIAKLTEEEIELWKLLKKYLLQNMFI